MDDALTGGAWQLDPETRTSLRLSKLRTASRQGAWEEVVLEAEELLDEQPNHPEGLFLLGEALLEFGDWEVAALVYDQRVSIDGGDGPSLTGLAVASYHGRDLPRAVECAREAIRLDLGNAEAHHYLGLALGALGHALTALGHVPVSPDVSASDLEQDGAHDEGARALATATELDPLRFPAPLSLPAGGSWEAFAETAVGLLPDPFREVVAELPFELADLPPLDMLRDRALSPGCGAVLLVDSEGNARAIALYTRNLAHAGNTEALVEGLTNELAREAADWLDQAPEPDEPDDA